MKYAFVLAIACMALLFSCKKDTNNVKQQTEAKIQGKWQIDSVVIVEKVSGIQTKTSHIGTDTEFVEFTTDGKMQTFFMGSSHTSSYVVRDDTAISINGDSAYILELSEKKFVVNTKADAGSIGSIEITYYLRR